MEQNSPDQAHTKSVAFPEFAWVTFTNRCNLDCAHCQRSLLKEKGLLKLQEMSWQVFERLESEVFPHLQRIQFGGSNFGEQLLASNWDSFFEKATKSKIGISIVTNGTLLNTDRISAMVAAGVEFNFSLEGVNKESYETIRGHSFDKFSSLIKQTCEQKIKRPNSGARVNLGFTIFYDNISEILDLIKMAAGLRMDKIVVAHFVPWKESQRQQSLVYHKELCNQKLEQTARLAKQLGIIVDLPAPFKTVDVVEETDCRTPYATKPCYHPWKSVFINELGDVMPCCATSVVMGNLERSRFSEIWNGRKYQKLRKTVNSARPMVFCRDCVFREIEMHSDRPISLWNDEAFLLSVIGTEMHKNSSSLVLRKIKNRMTKSRFGKKSLPHLTELYRRHGAFYVADIFDNGLTSLANKLLQKK